MGKEESAKAREEGNASFRKGRWADAATAYARAAEADPSDPIPWANRAMVMLKLERCDEAIRDASEALRRDPKSVKALYRRAVGHRGMGDFTAARADLESVLVLEPGNGPAKEELGEVKEEQRQKQVKEEQRQKQKQATAGKEKMEDVAIEKQGGKAETLSTPQAQKKVVTSDALLASERPQSFAAMRKSRDARPAYAAPRPVGGSATAPNTPSAQSVAPSISTTVSPTTADVSTTTTTPPIPPNPTSTAPGAGLALLRSLSSMPQSHRAAYVRHYAPGIIGTITAPVLEPDSLALLLGAISGVVKSESESDLSWARETLLALRSTRRWRMNAAMLSKAEKAIGEETWHKVAPGEGGLYA